MDPETLPDVPDDDGATALAFFREGLSSSSNFYAFLSLYKVISFIHRDGKQRGEWVARILPTLDQPDVRSRINEIQADGTDPSEYLRDSGRHAIAHAERDVFVNPDKLVDHERIYKDLPVVRALAQKAIEERFRIFPRASRDAPQKKSLPGFQRIFNVEHVAKLLGGDDIDWTTLRFPDCITALVRRGNQIVAFESMAIDEIARRENGIALRLGNSAETLFLAVTIDFQKRKLLYEPQSSCGATLDTDSRSSVGLFRKLHEFNWLYYGNGRLELWRADTDELLGMTDTYIPLNMFLNHKAMDQTRMRLQQMFDTATKD